MNDEHAHCAAPRRLLVLVGPASVVGHRFALEKFLVIRRWLIHDDQRDLALQVHACVVVPVVLVCVNAIPHKHDWRVEISFRLPGLILRNNLAAVGKIDGLAALWDKGKLCFALDGVYGKERNLLEVAAVLACGLQSIQRELRSNVFRRKFCAARAGSTPLKQIQRQKAHVRPHLLRINRSRSSPRSRRKPRNRRNSIGLRSRLLRNCDTWQ